MDPTTVLHTLAAANAAAAAQDPALALDVFASLSAIFAALAALGGLAGLLVLLAILMDIATKRSTLSPKGPLVFLAGSWTLCAVLAFAVVYPVVGRYTQANATFAATLGDLNCKTAIRAMREGVDTSYLALIRAPKDRFIGNTGARGLGCGIDDIVVVLAEHDPSLTEADRSALTAIASILAR